MPEEKTVFFIKVDDPLEVRRILLETSRDMIQILQKYERLKQIRVKKIENVVNLSRQIKEIDQIIQQIKRELPPVKLRARAKEVKPVREEKIYEAVKGQEELTKLENELSDIQKKLRSIS